MKLYKKHISDLGKVVTGKTPRTSISENYGGKIPFLTPSDDLTGKFVPITIKSLTELGLSEVKNCLLPKESVCVSCIGSDLGKVVITKEPTVTNQQFNSIIPNNENDASFIYYLMTVVGKHLNILSKTSTAVPIINKSAFSAYEIEVPSINDQKKISKILSSLDDKIEVNKRINDNLPLSLLSLIYFVLWLLKLRNDNLNQQAKTLFKSWFIDFEPFRDGKFVESEMGLIPSGWQVKELGEVTEPQNTRVKDRTDVKVLSPVTTGELVLSEEYFSKQVFSESIAKYIIVKPFDFAYNPARVNIGSLGMNTFDFDGCVSPVYVVFRCDDNYQYFFDLFRQTDYFKEEVKTRAIGGVRQTLGYKDFSLIKVVYPPKVVVEQFNKIYSTLLSKKAKNDIEITRLGELRDILLPKLMSGELKVSEMNM